MVEKENLHAGHRKRLREKFKTGRDSFKEHELLELLLNYSIPRKDTNALAHKLIAFFGSLSAVLESTPEELTQVEGVGETTANLISLVGYLKTTVSAKQKQPKLDSISAVKNLAISLFDGLDHEVFYIVYLDSQKRPIGKTMVDSGKINRVDIDFDIIAKAVMVHKPKSAIIMHNHFAKYPLPSDDDDKATAKLYAFLNFHKVSLFDHLIISGKEIYSYFYDNRLQNIKEKINDNLI